MVWFIKKYPVLRGRGRGLRTVILVGRGEGAVLILNFDFYSFPQVILRKMGIFRLNMTGQNKYIGNNKDYFVQRSGAVNKKKIKKSSLP